MDAEAFAGICCSAGQRKAYERLGLSLTGGKHINKAPKIRFRTRRGRQSRLASQAFRSVRPHHMHTTRFLSLCFHFSQTPTPTSSSGNRAVVSPTTVAGMHRVQLKCSVRGSYINPMSAAPRSSNPAMGVWALRGPAITLPSRPLPPEKYPPLFLVEQTLRRAPTLSLFDNKCFIYFWFHQSPPCFSSSSPGATQKPLETPTAQTCLKCFSL